MRRRASKPQQSQEVQDKESFRRRRASNQQLNQEEKGKLGASHNSPASSNRSTSRPQHQIFNHRLVFCTEYQQLLDKQTNCIHGWVLIDFPSV
jgi:hypothetical protein